MRIRRAQCTRVLVRAARRGSLGGDWRGRRRRGLLEFPPCEGADHAPPRGRWEGAGVGQETASGWEGGRFNPPPDFSCIISIPIDPCTSSQRKFVEIRGLKRLMKQRIRCTVPFSAGKDPFCRQQGPNPRSQAASGRPSGTTGGGVFRKDHPTVNSGMISPPIKHKIFHSHSNFTSKTPCPNPKPFRKCMLLLHLQQLTSRDPLTLWIVKSPFLQLHRMCSCIEERRRLLINVHLKRGEIDFVKSELLNWWGILNWWDQRSRISAVQYSYMLCG